jgi:hypothetical protein
MERALYEFALGRVMPLAKERTPVEFGTLRDSGLVDPPTSGFGYVKVELGFGGAASAYAIYVHEDLDAHHDVGQAKFLSSAMDDTAADFLEEVGANFARAMGM